MVMERAERDLAERAGGTPNLTYDLVALLHEKTEAIAAQGMILSKPHMDDARTVRCSTRPE